MTRFPKSPPRYLRPVAVSVLVAALLLAVLPTGARALSAQALVDRNRIGQDEALRLTVVVTDGDGDVDTSAIRDFDVASRGRSSSVRIVNTHMSREVRYQFVLSPRRTGTLTIPPLPVRDGSETARTAPIVVQVSEPGSVAEGSADLEVHAGVSSPSPYVGQEIVYTFSLERAVQLLQAGYQEPSFDGFTATKLEEQQSHPEVRNGRPVQVTEITYLLTPQRAGRLTIGPAVLTCQVPAPRPGRRGRSPFGDDPFDGLLDSPFFGRTPSVEKTLRTAPIELEVRPLPPAPAGTPFSGLVGTFSLAAAVEPETLPAGDSATVTLTLEGAGNLTEAAAPELTPPPGAKVYPDRPQEEITRDARGTRGTRTFRYAVVPTESGRLRLGPFRLVAFDPAAGRYATLEAGPVELEVTPGAAPTAPRSPGAAAAAPARPTPQKREVTRTGHDILAVRSDLGALTPRPELGLGAFLLWLAAPALLFGVARLLVGRRQRVPSAAERMARRADEALRQARTGDADAAGPLLHKALVSAVLARAGRDGESLTYGEARDVLATAGDEATGQAVADLLRHLDAVRYGGETLDRATLLGEVTRRVRDLTRGRR